jgi:hypothetical protein
VTHPRTIDQLVVGHRKEGYSASPLVVLQDVVARSLAIPDLFPTYDLASCLQRLGTPARSRSDRRPDRPAGGWC